MAPSQSRQLLIWTIPTIAVILSYFWYKRKRIESKTHPGDTTEKTTAAIMATPQKAISCGTTTASPRTFSRSLSGVESAPIDIILPPKLRATKSNSTVIPDEDLDLEIEKIKSMRYGGSIDMRKSNSCSETTENKSASVKKSSSSSSPEALPKAVMTQTVPEEKMMPFIQIENVKQEKSSTTNNETQRKNSERDSANHSPADVMMASPSLSSISDNHSEGSNDSGKGGSEVVTPPPSRSLGTESTNLVAFYEFIIPQHLVGKLIGKHGSSVANIKDKTGAHVVVRKHPTNNKWKVCSIEGSQKEIDSALKLIRDKFPLKRFPEVTLEQISFFPQVSTMMPDNLYLKLVEGVNNDTTISCIVAPNHLFLHQPGHPTFPKFSLLGVNMNAWYNETESPFLPMPVTANTICVAYSEGSWYRAIVLSWEETTGTCFIKFGDYGGYMNIEYTNLRQINRDFMHIQFQASECFLSNIKPIDESGWCEDAYKAVAEITKNAMIFTQVVDCTEDDIPLVNCYVYVGPSGVVFLNEELVKLGYADWIVNNQEEAAGVSVA